MQKFTRVAGIAVYFQKENIDTDAIIPAQWTRTASQNLGHALFAGWRYDAAGNELPDFILNREPFRRSIIMVGGANFGCGSSRETAVWALSGFGIRCVIAPSFGEIFLENCFKNGLLPITQPSVDIAALFDWLLHASNPTLTVDLQRCTIAADGGPHFDFEVPEARRTALLLGLDEIGQTLTYLGDIENFQARDRVERPWIYAAKPHA